jgi:hypothetical protein
MGIEESAAGRVMNKGQGVEGRDACVKRGTWSDRIIVKSGDDENRGMIFASSARCATVCTTLVLGEIMRISWLGGKSWISKELEGGEGWRGSPSWVVDAAEEPKAALVKAGMVR